MNASSAPWSFTPSLTALFYQLGIAFPLFFGAVRRSRTPLTLTLTLALAHDALLTPAHSAPQVLMFSATLHDDEVKRLAGQLCTQPTWVDLKGKDAVPETVDHMVGCPEWPFWNPSHRSLVNSGNHVNRGFDWGAAY